MSLLGPLYLTSDWYSGIDQNPLPTLRIGKFDGGFWFGLAIAVYCHFMRTISQFVLIVVESIFILDFSIKNAIYKDKIEKIQA